MWPLLSLFLGWSQLQNTEIQQQASRSSPFLYLYESHPHQGNKDNILSMQPSTSPFPPPHIYCTRHFTLFRIFPFQSRIRLRPPLVFISTHYPATPVPIGRRAPSSHNSPPSSVRTEKWKRPITFWREGNQLLIIEFSEYGVRYYEPHSSSHLPLRAGVLFLFKF